MALPARVALRHNITHTALPVRSNRVLQLFAHSAAASAAPYVSQEVTSIPAVPVPLCQRDASHVESVLSLMRWREDTLDAIKHIKDAFESADGGPASSELQVPSMCRLFPNPRSAIGRITDQRPRTAAERTYLGAG